MLPLPILIGIAVLAVVAVAVGILLAKNHDDGTPAQHSGRPQTRRATATFDSEELARRLQTPLEHLRQFEPSYHTAEIPKPKGGVRRLEIPDEGTKQLQRRILRYLLKSLTSHPFACGFEQHTSIVDAALPHQNKAVLVKMDVRRFFESTSADRVRLYFADLGWTSDAVDLLVKLTTHNGHLPQGAPTSPRLSNLVNARLDETLLRLARRHKGAYSRYADDITMSFPTRRGRKLRGLTQAVRRILKMYGYSMHGGAKLKFLRQNQRQQVLGLVVNSRVALPRKTRRWLRSVRHHVDNGRPATLSEEQLRGWEALAKMIEIQREDG